MSTEGDLVLAPPSSGEFVAYLSALLIVAGSVCLYLPMITRLAWKQCAQGLTVSTWWLKVAGYASAWLYSGINGYPLANYSENIIMTMESLVVLTLIYRFRPDLDSSRMLIGLAAFAGVALFVMIFPATWLLQSMQLGATVLSLGAVVPQIVLNYQQRASGEYSPVTAATATLGNMLRVITTRLLVPDDLLLLGCYAAGVAVQGLLFAQIVFYAMVMEGASLCDVLQSDFRSSGRDSSPSSVEVQQYSTLSCP